MCFFIAVGFWIIYIFFCNEDCRSIGYSNFTFIDALRLILPIGSILNCLRVATVFRLNDNDDLPENLFYASLGCLALGYTMLGGFLQDFIANSQKTLTNPLGFWVTIVTFFISVGLLLLDRQSWDKSTGFVKVRITLLLLHFTLFIINPVFGVVFSLVIIPVAIFWPANEPQIHFQNPTKTK